jgi:hypothetical protein
VKRKRGRPRGRKYPQPETTDEGFDIATYGKIGGSEAMDIVRDCPYRTINFIAEVPSKHRGRAEKKLLKFAPKLEEWWALRIGPIIGQKIASGDGEFFRQLANVVEEFSKVEGAIESPRRYLAIAYKFACDAQSILFTRKGLRDFYNRCCPGEKIDSSTLSKQFKWAQSAKVSNEGLIQELGPPRRRLRLRPENLILKP